MSSRMRSPSYPGTPLNQAIDMTRKIHNSERTNSVDREVAVMALGYSGLTGRSAKVLSDLLQYGLLEKTGKNEVRVAGRAVEIIHPESDAAKAEAIADAAFYPELFQRIKERFPDGEPSEGALRSYLIRENFTDAALPSAVRAYVQTREFVQQEAGSESNRVEPDGVVESVPDQQLKSEPTMQTTRHGQSAVQNPSLTGGRSFGVNYVGDGIQISGFLSSRRDVQSVITALEALLPGVPDDEPKRSEGAGDDEQSH